MDIRRSTNELLSESGKDILREQPASADSYASKRRPNNFVDHFETIIPYPKDLT